ncbi:hypothetical protein BpHYR1_020000 [Brachionus plicatilis]|uniref:Uncharacterized protein n=1 Tax=Brachionus plicatilis TaxID=10195 RepID=A0A3M7QZ43_BRAPC|nr:hypothetical protein BpHYR1_020000 [Brachionus plicatilis]
MIPPTKNILKYSCNLQQYPIQILYMKYEINYPPSDLKTKNFRKYFFWKMFAFIKESEYYICTICL